MKIERIRRYTSLSSALDILINKRLALLSPKTWKDRNDSRFLEAFREAMGYKCVHAACFTYSAETYHHWEVFARDNEGVCIEFDRSILYDCLEANAPYLYGEVEYLKLAELAKLSSIDSFRLPFLKRYGFNAEKEYRLIYGSEVEKSVHYIRVDIRAIKRITINPWAPRDLGETMKKVIQMIEGCENMKVYRSSLIDNDQWADACKRLDPFSWMLG